MYYIPRTKTVIPFPLVAKCHDFEKKKKTSPQPFIVHTHYSTYTL